jgi:formylglycine-generating enzyme required for sulfatase activity
VPKKNQNYTRYLDTYINYIKDHGLSLPEHCVKQLKRRQEYLKITDEECNNLQPQIEARVQEFLAQKAQEEETAVAATAAKAKEEAERRGQEERDRKALIESAAIPGSALIQISADRGALVRVGNEWQQKTERITVSGYEQELAEGIAISMVQIPAGSFQMGSPATEAERGSGEGPQHRVQLQSFFLGQTPVTQAQWKEVASWPEVDLKLNSNHADFKGANRPVETVSWEEAMEFCRRLSQRTKLSYTLPSEAQWEYACRAGTTSPFAFGDTLMPDLANYDGNIVYGSGPKGQFQQETTEVGSFAANAWGLQDMHGNVWEWCLDHWHDDYWGAPSDGSAWVYGSNQTMRLLRGGSWNNNPRNCRSANRNRRHQDNRNNNVGFRLCRFPPAPFIVRAVGRDSSGSTRRVQTRS